MSIIQIPIDCIFIFNSGNVSTRPWTGRTKRRVIRYQTKRLKTNPTPPKLIPDLTRREIKTTKAQVCTFNPCINTVTILMTEKFLHGGECLIRHQIKTQGRFHKLFCALRPTFEKLFRGVGRALRRGPNFDRAVSMICALRPTFMKSTSNLF